MEATRALLLTGGGHSVAAGFTLEKANWTDFTEALEAAARRVMAGVPLVNPIRIDLEGPLPQEADVDDVMALEPTGQGFMTPILATRGVMVEKVTGGPREKRIVLEKGGRRAIGIAGRSVYILPAGETVDVAYNVEIEGKRERGGRGDGPNFILRLVDLRRTKEVSL
jgi:single-stranded DNA-specific DHH superfamily exonuclease